MFVRDIVRQVREVAGDIAVLQFSNETITDWINNGVRECALQNSLLQAKAKATQVATQRTYTLPEDIFKIHSILSGTQKLEILSLAEWEDRNLDLTAVGTPTIACVYAGQLDLYPIPDVAGDIFVNYTKNPREIRYINDGTSEGYLPATPDIPVVYHNRLITYCLAQVALQDDDYAKYQAMMNEFTTGVVDLNHLKNQTEQHYPYQTYVDWDTW